MADAAAPHASKMMALGLFVFALHTVPYQQLQRQMSWRHPSVPRVGRRPARQFVGAGDDIITLSGVLYPEITGGRRNLAALQGMADEGKAWPLVEGTDTYYGLFVIEEIGNTDTLFFPDGAPRKIEFSIKLSRVDDDDPAQLGEVSRDLLDQFDVA